MYVWANELKKKKEETNRFRSFFLQNIVNTTHNIGEIYTENIHKCMMHEHVYVERNKK